LKVAIGEKEGFKNADVRRVFPKEFLQIFPV
jgi:hypothetical protein